MKLKNKLMLMYLIAGTMVLLLMGIWTYTEFSQNQLEVIESHMQSQLELLDFSLSNFFSEVENDVWELARNDLLKPGGEENFTSFLKADPATFKYNYGDREQKIINLLNTYRITHHPYVNSVYVGYENGSFVRSHPRGSPTQYDPRDRPWYVVAKARPGVLLMTDAYPSLTTTDVNIGNTTALVNETGSVYGVVGTDITLANLTTFMTNFDVEFSGQLMLVDGKGTILANRNEGLLYQNIQTVLANHANDFMKNKYGSLVADNQHYFYYTSPKLGWKIAAIIPAQVIDNEVQRLAATPPLLGLLFTIALFGILSLIGLNTFVTQPLNEIYQVTRKNIESSSRYHLVNVKSKDEIGSLGLAYNEMVEGRHKYQIALENSLVELDKSIVGTITTIASILEARDPYTAGHQKNVADLSVAIARDLGFSEDRMRWMYLAGLIHDLGKIQVPAEILSKPRVLTKVEFALVKTHPEVGHELLRNIEFPAPLAEIVYQHHERMDGSGYPRNIKGDDLLLEAKILAVADVVEAMSSHRPYRAALGIGMAVAEITANRGILYDEDIVDIVLKLFKEGRFSFG